MLKNEVKPRDVLQFLSALGVLHELEGNILRLTKEFPMTAGHGHRH